MNTKSGRIDHLDRRAMGRGQCVHILGPNAGLSYRTVVASRNTHQIFSVVRAMVHPSAERCHSGYVGRSPQADLSSPKKFGAKPVAKATL